MRDLNRCRPGQAGKRDALAGADPGPIPRDVAWGILADAFRTNDGRWLWVPAFAGTTAECDELTEARFEY
ncbi:protein of unknown function [Bradyrhizobium sp. ORS 285]|nr:protein of unknown function [Bradyrhizobium sp. ORS 285]